ncbi:MAG: hypothetical protein KGJ78_18185, partial [Alphaproteobacteria bacterium]|nr:hypothetical protein [Alphaproteobacteria bacterium]
DRGPAESGKSSSKSQASNSQTRLSLQNRILADVLKISPCQRVPRSSQTTAYESWLNERVHNRLRGRIFSVYMLAQMVAITAAQLPFGLGDVRTPQLFLLAGVLLALAALPVIVARHRAPAAVPPQPLHVFACLLIRHLEQQQRCWRA